MNSSIIILSLFGVNNLNKMIKVLINILNLNNVINISKLVVGSSAMLKCYYNAKYDYVTGRDSQVLDSTRRTRPQVATGSSYIRTNLHPASLQQSWPGCSRHRTWISRTLHTGSRVYRLQWGTFIYNIYIYI
jgi:hypothetical protein